MNKSSNEVKVDANNGSTPHVQSYEIDLGDRVVRKGDIVFTGMVKCGTKDLYDFLTGELNKPREYECIIPDGLKVEISGKKYYGRVILKGKDAEDICREINYLVGQHAQYERRLTSSKSGERDQLRTIQNPGNCQAIDGSMSYNVGQHVKDAIEAVAEEMGITRGGKHGK